MLSDTKPFTEFSPVDSFSGEGTTNKILISNKYDNDFKENDPLWHVGYKAFRIITDEINHVPTQEELTAGWAEMLNMVETSKQPFIDLYDKGNLILTTPDGSKLCKNLSDCIADSDATWRIGLIANLMSQFEEKGYIVAPYNLRLIFAMLCLSSIEEAIMCKFIDDDGMHASAIDAQEFLSKAESIKKTEEAVKKAITKNASKAANKRHEEDNQLKAEGLKIWREGNFKSAEAAARYITKQIPVKPRTVTAWIRKEKQK